MKPALDTVETAVQNHYRPAGLTGRIAQALRDAGKRLEGLTVEDLAPVDQYHSGGLATTKALAAHAHLGAGLRVLDVGCGIGGPARYLAATFGCHVTGIDLSSGHCETATELSRWVGLQSLTTFRQGSALELPFADGSFDRVWTQNVQMNIADKGRFYGELARVLKADGLFGFSDVLQGPGGPVIYPVVWAMDPSISFLLAPQALRGLLAGLGLREAYWRDATEEASALRRRQLALPEDDPRRTLSIEIVIGERAAERLANGMRNAEERRTLLVQAVYRKAG
jgi:SAM-dependent methyltransferase